MSLLKIRLHKLVSEKVTEENLEYTRPEIQKNIENYGVLVDETLVKNRLRWSYTFEKIKLDTWPKRQAGNFQDIKILKETQNYLVLFKPFGVVVESGVGHKNDNLLSWLEKELGNVNGKLRIKNEESKVTDKFHKETQIGTGQLKIKSDLPTDLDYLKESLSLVHRLDKDTQGLLLVAKNEESLEFFQNQFRSRSVEKRYLAVVSGRLGNKFEVTNWQTRDKKQIIRQKFFESEKEALSYDLKARKAISIFRPIQFSKELNQTLVEVEIKTGRMHQIRLQAEALGFPLVADKVYNRQLKINFKSENIKEINLLKDPETLDDISFEKLKFEFFGGQEYCLLSNKLKFTDLDGTIIDLEYKNT